MKKILKKPLLKESSGSGTSLKAKVITLVSVPLIMVIALATLMVFFISSFKTLIEIEQTEMINAECQMLDCDKDFYQTYVGYIQTVNAKTDEEYAEGREDIEKNMADVEKRIKKFNESMAILLENDPSLKENLWYYDDDENVTWYYDDILKMYDELLPVWKESLAEGATHDDEVFSELREATNVLGKIVEKVLEDGMDETVEELEILQMNIFILFIVLLVALLAVSIVTITGIINRTKLVNREIENISNFHLDRGYKPGKKERDEFAVILRNIADMRGKLNTTIHGILEASQQVDVISEELQQNADMIDNASQNVFSAMKSFIKSIDSQNSDAESVQDSAVKMGDLIYSMDEYVNKLMEIAENMSIHKDDTLDGMIELENSTQACSESIQTIYEQIEETSKAMAVIGDVTGAITNIASQTNLLALNSSIEAARAGNAGKGFAVVAEEIRNLAEQSNSSAHEISENVELLVQKFQVCFDVMRSVNQQISNQLQIFMNTKNMINNLSDGITDTVNSIEQIQAQSNDLSEMKDEVRSSIDSLASALQKNAELTQQVINDMENTTTIVNKIGESVNVLKDSSNSLDERMEIFNT